MKKIILSALFLALSSTANATLIETSAGTSLTTIDTSLGLPTGSIASTYNVSGSSGTNAFDGDVFTNSITFLGAGDITFDWVFGSNENIGFPSFLDDVAFVSIRNITTSTTHTFSDLARSTTAAPGSVTLGANTYSNLESGTFSVTGLAAGDYIIGIGIVNDTTSSGLSAIEITNFTTNDANAIPVPSSILLLGLGALGFMRRRS